MNLGDGNKNAEYYDEASELMPLGVADSYRYWGRNDTLCIKNMDQYCVTDLNERKYIDFRLAYGPIILGYRDKRVDTAVVNAIRQTGSMCGLSTSLELSLARRIHSMCPQIEKLRFANSGTEAIMAAVRTARGFTSRQKLIVIEGGFHGLSDEMMWKSDVENWSSGRSESPKIVPFGSGLLVNSNENVLFAPLNDLSIIENLIFQYGDDIAAVLIEPILGNCGSICATKEYLTGVRDMCDRNGSLLIFDEVKTGFRVSRGGAQALYGVYGDLTTYAKAIGNGYPISVFGGRSEVMDIISFEKKGVVHGGTYSANLVGLAAANSTLKILEETPALETISEVGRNIKNIISRCLSRYKVDHSFAGHNSMFGVHFSKVCPSDYRSWRSVDNIQYIKFAKSLISRGILVEPDSREPWFICEAHKNLDLNMLEEKINISLDDVFDV